MSTVTIYPKITGPSGSNLPSEPKFRVGQWVRVSRYGYEGRVGKVSYEMPHAAAIELSAIGTEPREVTSFLNEWLELFSPRPGERVRITRTDTNSFEGCVVGYIGTTEFRCEDWHVVLTNVSGEVELPAYTEFEPVFEEAENSTRLPYSSIQTSNDRDLDTWGDFYETKRLPFEPDDEYRKRIEAKRDGPDVRIKPNEALVREAERLMSRDVNGMRVALEGAEAEWFRSVGAPKTAERTHYDRKPRAEREAGRKAMAMEVLTAPWAGKKGRE